MNGTGRAPVLLLQLGTHTHTHTVSKLTSSASRRFITDMRLTTFTATLFLILLLHPLTSCSSSHFIYFQSPSAPYPCSLSTLIFPHFSYLILPSSPHAIVLSSSSCVFSIDFCFQLLLLLQLLSLRTIYILILHLLFLPLLHTSHFPLSHISFHLLLVPSPSLPLSFIYPPFLLSVNFNVPFFLSSY